MDKKYLFLFNAITDAINELDELKNRLVVVQQQAEEMYLSTENIVLMPDSHQVKKILERV